MIGFQNKTHFILWYKKLYGEFAGKRILHAAPCRDCCMALHRNKNKPPDIPPEVLIPSTIALILKVKKLSKRLSAETAE
jgi:hypothetical protein